MNKKIVLILHLLIFSTIYSQKFDSDSLVTHIRKDVTDFFVAKKILDKDIIKNDLDYVLITEINTHKGIGYDKNGIYTIAVFQSHSERHILIKNNTEFKIFDIQKIDIVLKAVIDFSIHNGINQNDMLRYLKRIIQMYDDNYDSKFTAIKSK